MLNKKEYHNGLDIAVPENTDAHAVRSGKVTVVRESKTLGNVLQFETDDGFTILYAHLKEILVRPGERIKQNQVIAKTGNTGLSTGPHIHYTVIKGTMIIDPMQFVTLKYTNEVINEYASRGDKIN